MLGRNEEINTIPFFWTSQYGKSIRYCGKLTFFISSGSCFLPKCTLDGILLLKFDERH